MGRGADGRDAAPIRFVQVSSASAPNITLPSAALRSSAIVLMRSGVGNLPIDRFVSAISELMHATGPGGFEMRAKPVPLPYLLSFTTPRASAISFRRPFDPRASFAAHSPARGRRMLAVPEERELRCH